MKPDMPLTHAIFDSGSRYSVFRKGFCPPVKMDGYFRWLAHRARARATSAPASPQDAAMASETPYAMAAARYEPSPYLILLAEAPGQPLKGSVVSQVREPTDSPRDLVLKVQLDIKDPRLAGRLPARFRVFLLDPEVRTRLLQAVNPETPDTQESLAAIFRHETVADNFEVARVLSAVPEADGIIGKDGYGQSEPQELTDMQPYVSQVPQGVTRVVLLGLRFDEPLPG